MAYPREVEAYPLGLIQTLEQVLNQGLRVNLPCKDDKEAKGLRLRFYALRRAIIDTLQTSKPHPLADQARKLKFTATKLDTSPTLLIEYLEDSPETQELAQRLYNAVEAAKGT